MWGRSPSHYRSDKKKGQRLLPLCFFSLRRPLLLFARVIVADVIR